MGNLGRRWQALLLAAVSALTIAACGGGDDEESSGGGGKEGGSITIGLPSQPDFLDPASAYTVNAWESQWLVYTPPLTYKRAEGEAGTEIIPGLAEELPTVSEDGKTYEFTIRKGVKYSDGTPVKASDFEHTIKRVLIQESGGSGFFLGIVGAEEYAEAGKENGDIKGITTDDETGKVTIELLEPDGTFTNVLATNFAGMVPGNTSFEILTENPPPGVGPYKYTKSVPNREFVMEKNANFDLPGIPKGKVDTITAKIIKSQERITQDVINGQLDYSHDPPPADLLPEVRSTNKDRYREFTVADIRYFWMDQNIPPFDNEKVRQAVNIAVDKRAIARLYGGLLSARPATSCPSTMPGYEKIDPCPWGDPNAAPDLEKARQLIKESGEEGAKVTVWGNTDNPDAEDHRVHGRRAEQDRPRRRAQDHRRGRVLPDHRQREDQGPGRLRRLVPGLPASGELLPDRDGGRDRTHQRDQLRGRQRPRDQQDLRRGQADPEGRGCDRPVGRGRSQADRGRVHRALGHRQGGAAPVGADGLRELRDRPSALQGRLLEPLPQVAG